jgi:hypothetical protein
MTRDPRETPRLRAGRGQTPDGPAVIPHPSAESADDASVPMTDEAAVARCYTKRTLCEWLEISIRTWDRAAAMGLTPAPDLIVGRSPRYSPSTIERWLRSHPRLPGRRKGGGA